MTRTNDWKIWKKCSDISKSSKWRINNKGAVAYTVCSGTELFSTRRRSMLTILSQTDKWCCSWSKATFKHNQTVSYVYYVTRQNIVAFALASALLFRQQQCSFYIRKPM